ncbi:PcfJ-like protein [uncultured Caudovirales phage]|uniref:PcfJ-like protein n=1 Tax=uncultured Caudovirales phage TaxID=2100421 RepID=A0A6J5KJN7_9CAUD|nr:PcfJ-like protein [uncultured Caudovirales phage]
MTHDIRSYINLLENHQVLLLEFNVINVEDIEKKIQALLPRIEYEPARNWFTTAVRKYLINDPESNARVTSISSNAPDWLKKGHESGQALYRFHASNDMLQKLGHLIDWLNSLYQTSQEKIDPASRNAQKKQRLVMLANKYLRGLNALDIRQLMAPKQEKVNHQVEDWFRDVNALADDTEDAAGIEGIIDYPNHYRWVSVKSESALSREGKLMGHCVGGYYPRVKAGQTQIYSLRDPQNAPHCTIEVTNKQIDQIKGKQNAAPTVKYVPYVQDFLNKIKLPLGNGRSDLERTGLVYDKEKQEYGSMYDLGEKLGSTSSGLEFVKHAGVIHIFHNKKDYGTIGIDSSGRGGDVVATITVGNLNDDAATNNTLKKQVYDEAIQFLNSQYTDQVVRIGQWSSNNPYQYYSVNNQLVHISEMPVVAELPHSSVVKYGTEYWFLDKATRSHVLAKLSDTLVPMNVVTGQVSDTLKSDVMQFMNQNQDKVNQDDVRAAAPRSTTALNLYDLVFSDGEWKPFIDGATQVKEWSGGGIYHVGNIWRAYDANHVALEWNTKGGYSGERTVTIKNPAGVSRHAQDLVDTWKSTKFTPTQVSHAGLSALKQLGILQAKGEWTLPKKAKGADEKGYSILKLSAKNSNIVDAEGTKVGVLEYYSANSINGVQIDNQEAGDFLVRYSAANPKVQFESGVNYVAASFRGGSSTGNVNLWKLGFFAHDGKFVRIREVWPTKKIIDSGKFTWVRRAFVFPSTEPSANRYVLNDIDDTVKLVLEHDKNNMVTNIIPLADNKAATYNEENVVPYLADLNILVKTLGLTVPGPFAAKAGLEFRDGQLQVPEASGKLRQFIDGRIMYEDGHAWIRSQYDKKDWNLVANIDQPYSWVLRCEVVNGDLQHIKFSSLEFKKNKKLYREYMLDMMDVIDQL